MKKILLPLLSIVMITSCSSDESEKSVIQKSISSNIEEKAMKDLQTQFDLLQVGNELEVIEVENLGTNNPLKQ